MDLEAEERTQAIKDNTTLVREGSLSPAPQGTLASKASENKKELGFVAVAAGEGQAEILSSLGVDEIVSGGQTMNPSTADLLNAIQKVNAQHIIVLPNNSNIYMAAEQAAKACEDAEVAVVPTKSILQAFSALFMVDTSESFEDIVAGMTEQIACVRVGEVTEAVRDSAAADGTPIHAGDVMGIVAGSIDIVGHDVQEVTLESIKRMLSAQEADTLTILAGKDMNEERFEALVEAIEDAFPSLDVDPQRGEQPLYPVLFSLE